MIAFKMLTMIFGVLGIFVLMLANEDIAGLILLGYVCGVSAGVGAGISK